MRWGNAGAATALVLAAMPGAMSARAQVDSTTAPVERVDYWERWGVVTLALRRGDDGFANPVEVVASYDSAASVDSLKALARGWRWVDDPEAGGVQFAHFSRAPRSAEPDRAPPSRVVELIRQDPKLRVWADACRGCLPDFDPGLFAAAGTGRFYKMPAAVEGVLAQRAAFGLIETSPDSSLALDPFWGIDIAPDSTAWNDPDTGFATYDVRTGARVHYQVMSYRENATAAWLDDSTFVVVGTVGVDHPASLADRPAPWIQVRAACLWLCDVRAAQETLFLGPPLPPTGLVPQCSALAKVRATLYPAVRWDW